MKKILTKKFIKDECSMTIVKGIDSLEFIVLFLKGIFCFANSSKQEAIHYFKSSSELSSFTLRSFILLSIRYMHDDELEENIYLGGTLRVA